MTRLDDDARYALAARADAAERANRPRWLVTLATLFFVVAGIYLLTAQASRSGAESARRNAAAQLRTVKGLLSEIDTLSVAPDQADARVPVGDRLPDFLSRMERVALRAGLESPLPVPSESDRGTFGNITGARYEYTITDTDIAALLRFVEMAKDEIPALQVHGVTITPQRDRWQLIVAFLRWQRTG